jgi:serine/threonine-protein kinase HipA
MSENELSVRLHGVPIGVLTQPTGRMVFKYYENAPYALSVNMPIRTEVYGHDVCEAFFGNLLPESYEAKRLIGLRFGANQNSTFSLLAAIGYDCAGAVSLHHLDEPVGRVIDWQPLRCHQLSASQLAEHIRQLPRQPLMAGVEGIRLSLAGAQDKAAVCMLNGRIALPSGGTPTSHILKPAIEGLEDTVANEFFTMRLAQRMGLTVAPVEIRQVEDIPFLLVGRYDRVIMPDGTAIKRIHQEDFCQALSVDLGSRNVLSYSPKHTARPKIETALPKLLFSISWSATEMHMRRTLHCCIPKSPYDLHHFTTLPRPAFIGNWIQASQ